MQQEVVNRADSMDWHSACLLGMASPFGAQKSYSMPAAMQALYAKNSEQRKLVPVALFGESSAVSLCKASGLVQLVPVCVNSSTPTFYTAKF